MSPKLWNYCFAVIGRGAIYKDEAKGESHRGRNRRENAGMSSEMKVRILQAEYPRFPE